MLMWSTGAKSGKRRCSVLTYTRDAGDYIVAGTASGAPTDPAWVANVDANPDVTLEIDNQTFDATARVEHGAERDRLWDQHVAELPWFGRYPAQTGGRVIPIVRLHPKSDA
jgi:deazaflavin-dependent oxidoreductase (nitroreductase family)